MKRTYNWESLKKRISVLKQDQYQDKKLTYSELSRLFDIPISTLRDNVSLTGSSENSGFQVKYNEDVIEIEDEGEFPKTPEALAKVAGIDLALYNVKSFDCFAREVQVKDVEKDLTFDNGKITGTIRDSGDMKIRTIWSSRLLLEPIKTKPRFVTLAPLVIKLPPRVKREAVRRGAWKTTLILPDIHFGFGRMGAFHDEKLLERVLDLAEDLQPDNITILGDLLDLAEFTDRFLPEPEAIRTTQNSLNAAGKFLARLEDVTDASKDLLEGNHELRLTNQIRKHLGALAGIHAINETGDAISIPYLLGLKDLGYNYISGWPNNVKVMYGIHIIHGSFFGTRPGQNAAKYLDKANWSTVFGHIHRREYLETKVWSDLEEGYKTIFAYSPGCLCRIDGAVPGSSAANGWGQGVGIMTTSFDGKSSIRDVPYDGQEFLI